MLLYHFFEKNEDLLNGNQIPYNPNLVFLKKIHFNKHYENLRTKDLKY